MKTTIYTLFAKHQQIESTFGQPNDNESVGGWKIVTPFGAAYISPTNSRYEWVVHSDYTDSYLWVRNKLYCHVKSGFTCLGE